MDTQLTVILTIIAIPTAIILMLKAWFELQTQKIKHIEATEHIIEATSHAKALSKKKSKLLEHLLGIFSLLLLIFVVFICISQPLSNSVFTIAIIGSIVCSMSFSFMIIIKIFSQIMDLQEKMIGVSETFLRMFEKGKGMHSNVSELTNKHNNKGCSQGEGRDLGLHP